MNPRQYQDFAALVRAIRAMHKLSQRAFAKVLRVSPGYVGQWELRLSQPSAETTERLCQVFEIADVEYVQRLAFAQKVPRWLRESIVMYEREPGPVPPLSSVERRVLDTLRRLPPKQAERLAERIEGWVEATLDDEAS